MSPLFFACVVPDGVGGLEYISTERRDSRQTYCPLIEMWVMKIDRLGDIDSELLTDA